MKHKHQQAGFTLVELLLATTFFSFVLLFISAGFIQVNRIYHSAVVTKNAQNNARTIFEQLSHDARDGTSLFSDIPSTGGSGCFGVGDVRYFYDEPNRLLTRAQTSDCGVAASDGVAVHEPDLNVYQVLVTPIKTTSGGTTRSLKIDITLGVADESLLTGGTDRTCLESGVGAALHLCSVVRFSGTVSTRGVE